MPIDLSKVFGPESRAYQIGDTVRLRDGVSSILNKPYLKELVGIVSWVGGGREVRVWFPESPNADPDLSMESIQSLSYQLDRRYIEDV